MAKDNISSLNKLEQNFKDLIMGRCGRLPLFRECLAENPDFEFPKITEGCSGYITIPGMLGGFSYYLEEVNSKLTLYAEQSSRMCYDSNSYMYFETTESGSRTLNGKEREVVQKKFWELNKKIAEEYATKIRKMRNNHESS